MDTALKQRLIGAAVLVALAVIFLPMLLQGPAPDGGASHVSLDLPEAPDRRFETREVPLALPGAPAAEIGLDEDDPNRVVTVDSDVAPRVDALPEDFAPRPAQPADALPAPAPVEPAPAPESAPSAPPPAPIASPAPRPSEPAPTPSSTPEARPLAADAGGNFAVNMGSYGDANNARALVQSLTAAGLPAYAESVSSGGRQLQRVRIGPFAQRAAAESARQRAAQVRSDINSSVVALESAPAGASATAAAPATAAGTGFAVQVGAFRSESDANALRDRIRGIGVSAFVERVQGENGPLWRVRAGPAVDRPGAERLRTQLSERLRLDGIIVAHP